jgi:integrase
VANERRQSARWSIAYALGLRQGEALGLRWRDLDLDESVMKVTNQLQRIGWKHGCGEAHPDHKPMRCPTRSGGSWRLEATKSRAGKRRLVMPEVLVEQMRDHRNWRTLLDEVGLPPSRLHDARHIAATLLLAQGVDGRVVMGLLGWSQASLLTRYQHVIDPMRRDAADKMGQAIWG